MDFLLAAAMKESGEHLPDALRSKLKRHRKTTGLALDVRLL